MKSSTKAINLAHLTASYYDGVPAAKRAADLIRRFKDAQTHTDLYWLLRHHDTQGISDKETWERDGFDCLLGYYGLIEIGVLASYLHPVFSDEFRDQALAVLDHAAVRAYYEWNYTLALPWMLRQRLLGRPLLAAPRAKAPNNRFSQFLEVSLPIERDDDLECFLWFLDGGARFDTVLNEYANLDNTRSVLRSKRKFVETIATTRGKASPLRRSVIGFTKFLEFCIQLELLLDSTKDEVLRAAFWHYHAYWFIHAANKLKREIPQGVELFAQWESTTLANKPSSKEDKRILQGYRQDSVALKRTIGRLTSGEYGESITYRLPPELAFSLR